MPTYGYRCLDCGTGFDKRMSMSAYAAGEPAPCPDCGSARTERSFGTVNVLTTARGGTGGANCGPSGFG